ncbi:hypothetical protein HPP92_009514 [Vanilla planifolia]|uniref:Uncharacterized protein n=1 Tax=Vanilla planifolia TaxID=51239 RepID=A0A835V4S5_VANPL|nr:hypothetical protein HPP92_009514 [Vanilla planifolia]
MSTLHGLDLRWSGPITPAERQYVEQYVLAKYPQYSHGLVEESDKNDLYSTYYNNGDATVSPGEEEVPDEPAGLVSVAVVIAGRRAPTSTAPNWILPAA